MKASVHTASQQPQHQIRFTLVYTPCVLTSAYR